jgi:TatD DNase family protein
VISQGFVLGIGGPLTYPKNQYLRDIFSSITLHNIVLETDAPFLPPQEMRGKQNNPAQIATIAHYLAHVRNGPLETIAKQTTANAQKLFNI